MEENTVNIIRESTRNLLKLNRQVQRAEESFLRRSIQEKRISLEDISEIANRLKTKSAISETDLQTLKNGLMEDGKYAEIVLNVHGALRGIIRELTGHNVNKQCAAAGCLCNLALGDGRACGVLAKAAGSYLVAALDSFTSELAVTCAWTLGNLAGSDSKVCDILVSQGAVSKLSELHINEDLQDAALYALVHFAYQMRDELRTDHLIKIMETLSKLQMSKASAQLLFILSCHTNFPENVCSELLPKILNQLAISYKLYTVKKSTENDILLYLIRTLANLTCYDVIFNFLIINNLNLKILLNNNKLCESVFWLVGNLFNNCKNKEFYKLLI